MARWIRWHRRIAYAVTVFLIIWILSGWIHPILSRMGPTLKPVTQWLEHPDPIHQARLALISKEIALSPASVTQLNQFNDEYQAFQKVLPVWRVVFEDEKRTRVMIDANTGKVMSGTDEEKLQLTRIFKFLHTWDVNAFTATTDKASNPSTQNNQNVTNFLIAGKTVMAAGLTILASLGVLLLILRRKLHLPPGNNTKRIWHRRLGAILAIPLLCFAISGLLHLHRQTLPDNIKPVEKWTFNVLHKWRFADGLGRDVRDILQFSTTAAFLALMFFAYRSKNKEHSRQK
jgi:hypothetical protein